MGTKPDLIDTVMIVPDELYHFRPPAPSYPLRRRTDREPPNNPCHG